MPGRLASEFSGMEGGARQRRPVCGPGNRPESGRRLPGIAITDRAVSTNGNLVAVGTSNFDPGLDVFVFGRANGNKWAPSPVATLSSPASFGLGMFGHSVRFLGPTRLAVGEMGADGAGGGRVHIIDP